MITTETISFEGREFIRTFSDTHMIRKIGTSELYTEAIDVPGIGYSYEETDELLETKTELGV